MQAGTLMKLRAVANFSGFEDYGIPSTLPFQVFPEIPAFLKAPITYIPASSSSNRSQCTPRYL